MKDPLLSRLRQQLRESPPAPAQPAPRPAPPPKPAEDEVDDATLFARATQGARRLASEAPPPAAPRRRPDANTLHRRAAAVAEDDPTAPVSDTAALLHAVAPEESLSFARNGVQVRVLQKLRQGQPAWQAAVDLHGCTVDEAREAVLSLLRDAGRAGLTVVKIVHGKGLSHDEQHGQSLLKTCVNGWLRQLPAVLAFVSALPRDGGTGAVYVLLKRRREESESQVLAPRSP